MDEFKRNKIFVNYFKSGSLHCFDLQGSLPQPFCQQSRVGNKR